MGGTEALSALEQACWSACGPTVLRFFTRADDVQHTSSPSIDAFEAPCCRSWRIVAVKVGGGEGRNQRFTVEGRSRILVCRLMFLAVHVRCQDALLNQGATSRCLSDCTSNRYRNHGIQPPRRRHERLL